MERGNGTGIMLIYANLKSSEIHGQAPGFLAAAKLPISS
jgi:hypothetical protein